ncbi:TetR/AcrR family transcriptional regulator [Nocardia arthritidis]|uniref:TetR family transcriptional regulator n=1 Tax=Nocardia arthritidis TaxID=228602 RepID=A0A6G9YR13_9NOCA|nr:TetR/AcrR family transcriptional regulator [Nocardia arthritidis]QIS15537.1 TetR family transcriptional regulator [Nocardia arthritidis]
MLADLLSTTDEHDATAEQIIDTALAEFTEFGIRRVSIADVAKRAGLHRATVHRRFPTKDDLVTAAMITWSRRFFETILAAVTDLTDFEDRLVEGFTLSLKGLRSDPLVSRLLVTDADTVLPLLTTQGGPVLTTVTEFFAEQYRAARPDDPDVDIAAELATRIGLSLILTPASHAPLRTDDEIRAFARRYLLALI